MGLARGLGPKSSKIVHFKWVHCNFPILGSKKNTIFGDFSYRKPFFHPDGVFLEQLIHKQICSQYRKLQFFGSEDLYQNIFLKVISCSMQKFFFGNIALGGIFSPTVGAKSIAPAISIASRHIFEKFQHLKLNFFNFLFFCPVDWSILHMKWKEKIEKYFS